MHNHAVVEGRSGGTLLRLSDAANRLRVEYATIYKAAVAGRIPATRDTGGARWLVRAEDLAAIAVALGVQVPA